MTAPRLYLTLFVVIAQLFAQSQGWAQLDADRDYQRSINEVGKKISAITRTLNTNKAELKTERDKLFDTEQKLSKLSRAIEQTDEKILSGQAKLSDLNKTLETTLASQVQNRDALEALIVSRYKQGDKNYLKLLLNQENPYAVGRLNNYHNYFSKALREKFSALQEQAAEIAALKATQTSAIEALARQKQHQNGQKINLNKAKKARAQSVAKLSSTISEESEKLTKLNKDRQRLDSLIKQIAKQKAELERLEKARRAQEDARRVQEIARREQEIAERAATPPTKPAASKATVARPVRAPIKGGFVKQKGRLSYPVDAKRKRNFGSLLVESGMTSDGIFFDTSKSQPVKSIFRGQVLFADFLKGYGLLLIIDHGDDHISLYGHNELLYKKVGDTVETDEVVGKTGVTGGLKSPGLYFEIRNNANPVNPGKWCQ